MINLIQILNFVTISRLDLELAAGLSVITGETGAGKSVLLSALGFALGDRASVQLIRPGAERAEVSLVLQAPADPDLQAWLAEQGLEDEGDELLLRRSLGQDGRSRAYINGRPSTINSLRDIGDRLVDIHGQHAHHALLRREVQRQLLDDHAGLGPQRARTAAAYRDWRQAQQRLDQLRGASRELDERRERLSFQCQQLRELAPEPGEWEALGQEQRRLAHAERLLGDGQRAHQWIYEGEISACSLLGQAQRDLEALAALDPRLGGVIQMLDSAAIQAREAGSELADYLSGIELDPQRLAWVDERLATMRSLARRHQCDPEQLPGLLTRLESELADLEAGSGDPAALERTRDQALDAYLDCAARLSSGRRHAAAEIAGRISALLPGLGMAKARLDIHIEALALEQAGANGQDRVEFLVATNPGQTPRPLAQVASGGELSRLSLAVQVVTSSASRIPSFVFDEVDTGVGGGVAEVVGRQLRALGEAHQVLCITHLPQVAAQGHHHLHVDKTLSETAAETRIRHLDPGQRVEELARMLGGLDITESTRAHAREMLERPQLTADLRPDSKPVAKGRKRATRPVPETKS